MSSDCRSGGGQCHVVSVRRWLCLSVCVCVSGAGEQKTIVHQRSVLLVVAEPAGLCRRDVSSHRVDRDERLSQ